MHTATLGDLDLTANGYGITSFDARNPGQLRLRLDIDGDDEDDVIDKIRAIETQINRATQGAQPASGVPWVTLAMKARLSSTLVEYLVRGGSVPPPVIADRSMYEFEQGWLARVDVELECLPETLGPELEYGPFDATGASPTLHIDGIPGKHPALAELRIVDQSTNGAVINRLRWAYRSLPELEAGQFDPVLGLTGENSIEDTDTFSGTYQSIAGAAGWQTIGRVSGSAGQYTSGLYDIWIRQRDSTANLGTPSNVEATAVDGISVRQDRKSTSTNLAPTITLNQESIDGNLLLLAIMTDNAPTFTVPTGFLLAATVTKSGGGPKTSLYYYPDAPPTTTVQIGYSTTPLDPYAVVIEYRGVPGATVDVTATNTADSTSSASTGTTATTTQAYALGIAVMNRTDGPSNNSDSSTAWNAIGGFSTGDGATMRERKLTALATQSLTFSVASALFDWANLVVVFKGTQTVAPTVPDNDYSVKIVAVDVNGNLSAASSAGSVTLVVDGALLAEWESGTGAAVDYRFYWKKGSADWKYVSTGSALLTYQLNSESGGITEDPPDTTTIIPASFRLKIGPESGVTDDLITTPFAAAIANSTWEAVYAGRAFLPPGATPLVASTPGYLLSVQGKSSISSELDVDAIMLLPADEQQMDAQFTAGSLDTLREWVIGTTPDMRSYGFLRSTVDASEQGHVKTLGYALLGPGDTTMVFLPTVAGGVWNVEDVAFEVTVIVRPRYGWIVGSI